MEKTTDDSQRNCTVCGDELPEARMALSCSSCGRGLHPACAARVERGPGWANRTLFCASCAADHPGGEHAVAR